VAAVLANWHNVLRAINMASSTVWWSSDLYRALLTVGQLRCRCRRRMKRGWSLRWGARRLRSRCRKLLFGYRRSSRNRTWGDEVSVVRMGFDERAVGRMSCEEMDMASKDGCSMQGCLLSWRQDWRVISMPHNPANCYGRCLRVDADQCIRIRLRKWHKW
jgi:hypothetical protein